MAQQQKEQQQREALDRQVPVAELQFGSKWQVGEQPSLGRVFPSSQPSVPSTMPSPQMVAEQTLGLPLHL